MNAPQCYVMCTLPVLFVIYVNFYRCVIKYGTHLFDG